MCCSDYFTSQRINCHTPSFASLINYISSPLHPTVYHPLPRPVPCPSPGVLPHEAEGHPVSPVAVVDSQPAHHVPDLGARRRGEVETRVAEARVPVVHVEYDYGDGGRVILRVGGFNRVNSISNGLARYSPGSANTQRLPGLGVTNGASEPSAPPPPLHRVRVGIR